MYFPSITLCNFNLVEASFYKTHNIPEADRKRRYIVNEFIRGLNENIGDDVEVIKYFNNLTAGKIGD